MTIGLRVLIAILTLVWFSAVAVENQRCVGLQLEGGLDLCGGGRTVWEDAAGAGLRAAGSNFIGHYQPLENLWADAGANSLLKPVLHGVTQGGIGTLFGQENATGFGAGLFSSVVGRFVQANRGNPDDGNYIGDEALTDFVSQFGAIGGFVGGGNGDYGALVGSSVFEYNDMADLAAFLGGLTEAQRERLIRMLRQGLDENDNLVLDSIIDAIGDSEKIEDLVNRGEWDLDTENIISTFLSSLPPSDNSLIDISDGTRNLLLDAVTQAGLHRRELGAYESDNDFDYRLEVEDYERKIDSIFHALNPMRIEVEEPRHADDWSIELFDSTRIAPIINAANYGLEWDPNNNYSGTSREAAGDFIRVLEVPLNHPIAVFGDVEGDIISAVLRRSGPALGRVFSAVSRTTDSLSNAGATALRNASQRLDAAGAELRHFTEQLIGSIPRPFTSSGTLIPSPAGAGPIYPANWPELNPDFVPLPEFRMSSGSRASARQGTGLGSNSSPAPNGGTTFRQHPAGNVTSPRSTERVEYSDTNQLNGVLQDPDRITGNTQYVDQSTGYSWKTDRLGRTQEVVVDDLRIDPDPPATRERLQTDIGNHGSGAQTEDVGFHLVGHQFEGPTNYLNVVPGNGSRVGFSADPNLNQGAWSTMEGRWAAAIDRGDEVKVGIKPVYNPGNNTSGPDAFAVMWKEGDQLHTSAFANEPGAVVHMTDSWIRSQFHHVDWK